MAVLPGDVVAQMRASLTLTEPNLDTTVGTSVRKILDVVGEVAAAGYADRYLLDYQYDVDTKSGADLDDFATRFGFTRLAARRGTGTVTFERSAATTSTIIPIGTQLATDDSIPVTVATIVPAVMLQGDLSISVPAQALNGGAGGNIAANSLRLRVTPLDGVGSFTNLTAFTGGADSESDAQLRDRFKRTLFRNLAGTEQMFTAVALEDPDVTQVNVLGASERRREQVQVTGGTATSVLVGARHVYPRSAVVGSNIDQGLILTENVHYTFNPTLPPSITSLTAGMPDGIYDFEFEYVPGASRNDPTGGVTNRVDIYVNGARPIEAAETAIFRPARVFNTTANDPLNRTNFQRTDSSLPVAGNYFVALAFAPVTDAAVGSSITINGVVYVQDTDFYTVNDISREGGTSRSLSGIEIRAAANGGTKAIPADGQSFAANYVYNAVPRDVEQAVREWRLITTDVRVHQARPIRLDVHLVAILQPGLTVASVQAGVQAALRDYVNGVGFGGVVQVSDLLAAAHAVPGIDAVRMATSADGANYGIREVNALGANLGDPYTTVGPPRRAIDVLVGDDQVAAINAVTLTQRAQNSYGTV